MVWIAGVLHMISGVSATNDFEFSSLSFSLDSRIRFFASPVILLVQRLSDDSRNIEIIKEKTIKLIFSFNFIHTYFL